MCCQFIIHTSLNNDKIPFTGMRKRFGGNAFIQAMTQDDIFLPKEYKYKKLYTKLDLTFTDVALLCKNPLKTFC